MPYNVIIVDDQNISRQLFEMVVSGSERYQLLYALDSASVVHIYCARYHVDLVIMDIVMRDGSDGLQAAEKLKREHPETKIVIVTSMPEVSYLERARAAGVESFWYKEYGEQSLIDVMDRTMNGESVYPERTPILPLGSARSTDLTPAELTVLREMTTGASNRTIAEKLCIDINTVKKHISHMLQKTGLQNRTELAIEARMSGIVIGEKER